MNEIEKLEDALREVLVEVETYNKKPNKSLSGRIRKQLGEIKKDITPIRALLVKADKTGY